MKLYRVTMVVAVDVWAGDKPEHGVSAAMNAVSGALGGPVVFSEGKPYANPCMNLRVESQAVQEWKAPL